MVLPLFQSNAREALKRLEKGAFASSEERDQMLEVVLQAGGLKPKHVVWMLFRPDRAIRSAGAKLLQAASTLETADVFLEQCANKPEAAVRAAAAVLFDLKIEGLEAHLGRALHSGDGALRDAVAKLVLSAPPRPAIEPILWDLATDAPGAVRKEVLNRLALLEISSKNLPRWQQLARHEEREIRERALTVLADKAPGPSVDLIVTELPRSSYATQQHLIAALTKLSQGKGPEFADRILPLMASADAGTRSAVLKILLGMENRPELIKRYLLFSKTLAGWARDRALESMKDFGADLVEPTLELLSHPDEDVRAAALVVAGGFDDPRIVPATIELLSDPDWWLRITAADTLGRFADPRAVEPLIELLSDSEARWAAVEALGRIGDVRALPALARLLQDPAPEVRIEVLVALKGFKHPKILAALRQVAASDADRMVRSRALEIAEEVARRGETELEDAGALRKQALRATVAEGEPRLHRLLVATRNQEASDFHLSVARPPMVRLSGELMKVRGDVFTATDTEGMLREILTEEQWRRLQESTQLDFCYYVPRAGRYRANVFLDQRGYNAVFRVIPEKPPTITDIGLPDHLSEIAAYHQGLILICGPAGSGKSTTLAALVNLFNETRHDHIITLEDPVEFVHPFKNCLVNQREVGSHTKSFARALRAALREDPDVIVIGDLRDNETVSLALIAAETGHVVLGTLNSTTAHKAVDRIISSFSVGEQPQVRASMSESLKFVIAQRLLPGREKYRQVACFEVLKATIPVANLIREEKTLQILSAMQMGRSQGMQTFDDALRDLLRRDLIKPETAYMAATSKEEFEPLVPPEFLNARDGF